jgi:hypothetical protein
VQWVVGDVGEQCVVQDVSPLHCFFTSSIVVSSLTKDVAETVIGNKTEEAANNAKVSFFISTPFALYTKT